MTIAVGGRLPEVTFKEVADGAPVDRTTSEIFGGKTVALFAVPGAFTPTCHEQHLPGFLSRLDAFKAKGVDDVVCTAVNDVFVMGAWARDSGAVGKIRFLADGNGDFARAIGMDADLSVAGLGTRSKRYAMLVKDGVVAALNIEPTPSSATVSSADALLEQL